MLFAYLFAAILSGLVGGSELPQKDMSLSDLVKSPRRNRTDFINDLQQCGPRSLAAFLEFHGYAASLSDILRDIPIDRTGCGLDVLQNEAQSLGCNAQAITYARLDDVPLPAIAHFEPNAESALGHFVILVDVHPDEVLLYDSVRDLFYREPRDRFLAAVSGAYLVRDSSLNTTLFVCSLLLMLLCVCLAIRVMRTHVRLRRIVPMMACLLVSGCNQGDDTSADFQLSANPRALSFTRSVWDFGVVSGADNCSAVFKCVNCTNDPVTIDCGKPSCGCLTYGIAPGDVLQAGQEAEVTLTIRGAGRKPGLISESLLVGLKNREEFHRLTVVGVVEGAIQPWQYVLRQSDAPQHVPLLVLKVFASKRNSLKPPIEFSADPPIVFAELEQTALSIESLEHCYAAELQIPLRAAAQLPTISQQFQYTVTFDDAAMTIHNIGYFIASQ
jgi:hypothetical protein